MARLDQLPRQTATVKKAEQYQSNARAAFDAHEGLVAEFPIAARNAVAQRGEPQICPAADAKHAGAFAGPRRLHPIMRQKECAKDDPAA